MYETTIQDLYKDIEKLRRRVEYLERVESDAVLGGYLNFSGTGETGYGFRDNVGVMEVKDDDKAWYSISRANTATISFYVDGMSGSDSTGDGTISTPYATIGKALAMLPQLITAPVNIYIAIGTYAENLDFSGYMGDIPISLFPYDPIAGKTMYTSNVQATVGETSSTTIGSSALDLADLTGGKVWIDAGTGKGQVRSIGSNNATTITVTSAWETTPDTTSRFSCCGPVKISAATYAITSTGKSFSLFGLWLVSGGTYAVYAQRYVNVAIRSCYIEPAAGGILFTDFSYGTIRYNCIELTANRVYGVLVQSSSNVTAFGNVITSVSATGTYGIRLNYASFLYAGLNTTTYPYNCISGVATGISLTGNSSGSPLELQTYSGCTTNYDGGMSLYGSITHEARVVRNTFYKTLADAAETAVFNINTTAEAGSNDGGAWTCWVHAIITHGNSSTTTANAAKGITAQFCRVMLGSGAGVSSAVSEVVETSSAASDAATRDIGAVTFSLTETSEYTTAVKINADATGTSVGTLEAIVAVELVYYGFLHAPTLTQA